MPEKNNIIFDGSCDSMQYSKIVNNKYSFLDILYFVFVIVVLFFSYSISAQSAGFNSSFAVFDTNASGDDYYCMFSNTSCGSNGSLDGADLGVFASGSSLILKGAEIINWKCNGADITSTEFNYRIYKTGETPGSFITKTIPYLSTSANGCSGQDQVWKKIDYNVNMLTGLDIGFDYVIEIYLKESTTEGDKYLSNNSNNYKATFTIPCNYFFTGNSQQDPTDLSNPDNWMNGCVPDPSSTAIIDVTFQSGQIFSASGTYNWNVINNGILSPKN